MYLSVHEENELDIAIAKLNARLDTLQELLLETQSDVVILQKINAKKAIEHPDYNEGTDEFDIAILVLEEPTTLDIALVKVNKDNNYPAAGRIGHTMGWGDTDASDGQKLSDELMVVDVEVISNSECDAAERGGDSYDGDIKDSMVCTFTNGQDACQGDSGGPLVIEGNTPEDDVVFGIVSWGIGCAFLPGVYSRVSQGYDWIERTTCEESAVPPGGICGPPPTRIPTQPPTRNVSFSLSVLLRCPMNSQQTKQALASMGIMDTDFLSLFTLLFRHTRILISHTYHTSLVFLVQPTSLPTRFPTRNVSFNVGYDSHIVILLNHLNIANLKLT
jgi:trypsin